MRLLLINSLIHYDAFYHIILHATFWTNMCHKFSTIITHIDIYQKVLVMYFLPK